MPSINDQKSRVTASVHAALLTIGGVSGLIVAGVALQFIDARLSTLAIALTFLLAAIGIVRIALENTQLDKRLHVWMMCAFLGVVFIGFVGRHL